MTGPLVSVIIPAYNAVKTLERCLESVLAQDYETMEIIVVDDGSKDETRELIRRYAEQDSRIHPICQENKGVSAARNAALAAASGEYIRFADSDDRLTAGAVSHMVALLEKTGADMAVGGFNEIIGPVSKARNLADRNDEMDTKTFMRWMHPHANSFFVGVLWNKLFRADIIRRTGASFREGLNYGEDFLFVMSCLRDVKKVVFTKKIVYDYIRNSYGLTLQQAVNSIRHPLSILKTKKWLYMGLLEAYRSTGCYEEHKHVLWLYWIRFALNN